jgi:hypothetical protein
MEWRVVNATVFADQRQVKRQGVIWRRRAAEVAHAWYGEGHEGTERLGMKMDQEQLLNTSDPWPSFMAGWAKRGSAV